ncbi:DUF6461 domain-containing protein [Actinoplanes sp. NPDC023714]|uniref:DUF6461 domain-containing protein n=1 Tax=Actinoplanes sp. NPDC023714 TaxID=3154322 RepID=UPI0033DB814A
MVSYYREILNAEPWLAEALCVTWFRGIGADEAFRAFGADPATAEPLTPERAADLTDHVHYSDWPDVVKIGPLGGDWLVAVEVNGFQGTRPEVLRPLSRNGAALTVFWNVNAVNEFAYAAGGRTVVSFEMSDPQYRHGSEPGFLDERMAGLPFGGDGDFRAAGLALAERVTGHRLTRETILAPLPGAVLTPVPEDLVPESLTGDPALQAPFLTGLLAATEPGTIAGPQPGAIAGPQPGTIAGPEQGTIAGSELGTIAFHTARIVAEDTGLDADPAVRAALTCLANAGPVPDDVRAGLDARYQDRAAVATDVTAHGPDRADAMKTMYAIGAIAAQLGRDPDPARRDRMGQGGFRPARHDLAVQFEVLRRIRHRRRG